MLISLRIGSPERMLNGGFENLPPDAWKPFGR